MTVKCTFCNDTKQEPGIPGPCVWCEQVGAAPVAVGYQLAKGFTDPVGDCEKFEAGITVNAWLQRIVVYGDSPADAEALRDHIMASAEREAALREELSKLADDYCEKVDDILDLQQRLTVAEQRAAFLERVMRDTLNDEDGLLITAELNTGPTWSALQKHGRSIEAALKPAAEGEGA